MGKKVFLSESEIKRVIKRIIKETLQFDSEIEKVQKELKGKYYLGNYGPNRDGVDGNLGKLTKKAMKGEFETNPEFKKKYEHLLLIDTQKVIGNNTKNVLTNKINSTDSSDVVIFVSGLHHRRNDLSVSEQESKLRKGLNSNKTIFSFSHSNSNGALNKLEELPNSTVILFSMGTRYSNKFASKMENKSNLFIVEPYPGASDSVIGAVTSGVPRKNVILGGGVGSGKGMIQGATNTPKEYSGHWPALTFVGQLVK